MLNTTETYLEDWPEFIKTVLKEESYSSKVLFSIALLIVFTASLVGNILICIVIYYDKTMHTATNYYLFNLAVTDLLVTFPILIIVHQLLIKQSEVVEFRNGLMSCKFFLCIHFVFVSLLWNNGILVMTALSIERYIAICNPMMLKGKPVWGRVGKIFMAIWTMAILQTLPQLWTLDILDTEDSLMCFLLPTPTAKTIIRILAVTTFVVPLSIMLFVYTMIAFKVNNSLKCNIMDSEYSNGFKRKNVTKLIALTVSFVVCWLPYFLIRTIMFSTNVQDLANIQTWFGTFHKIAMFNSWFTTVLNPLLFSIMSIKFRKALKTLWHRNVMEKYFKATEIEVVETKHKVMLS